MRGCGMTSALFGNGQVGSFQASPVITAVEVRCTFWGRLHIQTGDMRPRRAVFCTHFRMVVPGNQRIIWNVLFTCNLAKCPCWAHASHKKNLLATSTAFGCTTKSALGNGTQLNQEDYEYYGNGASVLSVITDMAPAPLKPMAYTRCSCTTSKNLCSLARPTSEEASISSSPCHISFCYLVYRIQIYPSSVWKQIIQSWEMRRINVPRTSQKTICHSRTRNALENDASNPVWVASNTDIITVRQ